MTGFSAGKQNTMVMNAIHKQATTARGLDAEPRLNGPRLKLRG